jgi:GR25 family glycosyltransferase involved in LPS biosynthesis
MSINELFDEVYYINLNKRVDRREQFENQIKKNNIKAIRFEAISVDDIKNAGKHKHLTETALPRVAVMSSHMAIWRDCYNRGVKSVLIFEDDTTFVDDFNLKLKTNLKSLPNDYDAIHFDYGRNSFIFKNNLMGLESVNDYWDRIKFGCSGYQAVGYRGTNILNKIITVCEKNTNGEHFDLFLRKNISYNSFNVYTPKISLTSQNPMGSDNSNI